ncbi:MAG TPA: SIS domain-containing protein [Candidatus Limnocylindria bacterium]|nr:SIS domain-containing protein [Candidatus Limnocylindria bacterium]
MEQWIADYIAAQQKALNSVPHDTLKSIIEVIRKAWQEDRQIFIAGNGGSAANASHFAVDLGKGASDVLPRRFRVLSLTDNTPWITAIGNDYSYDDIFSRQMANFARAGDVFIGISVSGNSPNLVKAYQWAKERGVVTVALVGKKRGQMAELADHVIVIDDTHYGRVEDVQMNILHILCYAFWERPEIVK